MSAYLFYLLSVAAFCNLSRVASVDFTSYVDLGYGKIRGKITNDVQEYLGVPYAAASRLEPPTNPTPFDMKDTISQGYICPQASHAADAKYFTIDEDCLNLNIFVSNIKSHTKRPVMMFIHGGSFQNGSNANYSGRYLASEGAEGVIVVVPNHRLGVLGFAADPRSTTLKGNLGLKDLAKALEWIHENIVKFGGDNTKITVAGHDAGATLAGLLMLSTRTKRLINNVIMQDGAPFTLPNRTIEQHTDAFRNKLNTPMCPDACPSNEQLDNCIQNYFDCMKTKSKTDLEILGDIAAASEMTGSWAPTVDDEIITGDPRTSKHPVEIEILIGVNSASGVKYTLDSPPIFSGRIGLDISNGLTRSKFKKEIRKLLTNTATEDHNLLLDAALTVDQRATVRSRYPEFENDNGKMFVDFSSDIVFNNRTLEAANASSRPPQAGKVFFYYFEHRLPKYPGTQTPVPERVGSYNGAQLPFLFWDMANESTEDKEFAECFKKAVANFVKTGSPNPPDQQDQICQSWRVRWPEYNPESQEYMALKPNPEIGSKLRADYTGKNLYFSAQPNNGV